MRNVLLVVGLLAATMVLARCSRSRCCPCPAPGDGRMRIEVVQRPAPEAPATWTPEQRSAALEATFALARARIARGADARDEALRAYADGAQGLAAFDAPAPLVALRRTLEEERALLERTPPAPPASATAGAGKERLVFYDVIELAAAMPRLGFPTVEIVGPEGSRVESPAATLGGQLYTLLPAAHGPITAAHAKELEAKNGVLILRADATRHAAMRRYLDTLRATWQRLWPEAFGTTSAAAPSMPPAPRVEAAPAGNTADPLEVRIHDVADLVIALERIGGAVDLGSPEDPPMERLVFTLTYISSSTRDVARSVARIEPHGDRPLLVVKATHAHQEAIAALLGAWRSEWSKRWPAAFAPPPGGR